MRTLSPADVIKQASAQAAAAAKKNASAAAAAARRTAEAAGAVVVVGAGGDGEDGPLGAAVLALFEEEVAAVGEKGAARVTSVSGVPLSTAKGLGGGGGGDGDVRAALEGVKTLVIVPGDSGSKKKKGGGGGGGLGGLFGGGGGEDAVKGEGLSDEEVVGLLDACGQSLKHVVCLSVGGASSGGGGGGLFGGGGGGAEDKGFPGESTAEQVWVGV